MMVVPSYADVTYRTLLCMVFLIQLTFTNSSTVESVPGENICTTEECNQTATRILKNMDPSVSPCDNFYQFVCGKHSEKTFAEKKADVLSTIQYALEETSSVERNESSRMAYKLYELCKAENVTNTPGINYLRKFIEDIGGWPVVQGEQWKEKRWESFVKELSELGYKTGVFFNISSHTATDNSSVIEMNGIRMKYLRVLNVNIIKEIAIKLGANRSEMDNSTFMNFINSIQLIHFDPVHGKTRDSFWGLTGITLGQMRSRWPSIDWMTYFTSYFSDSPTITVDESLLISTDFEYTEQIVELVKNVSNTDIVSFVIAKIIDRSIPYLKPEVSTESNADERTIHSSLARKKYCTDLVTHELPSLIFSILNTNYLDERVQDDFNKMTDALKNKMGELIAQSHWPDDQIVQFYTEKLSNLTITMKKLGAYPIGVRINEFDDLVLDERSFIHSMWSIIRFTEYSKWGGDEVLDQYSPFFMGRFFKHAYDIYAGYYSRTNEIVVRAGTLLNLRFKNKLPKYINYGRFGYIFGHEIAHGSPNNEVYKHITEEGLSIYTPNEWWRIRIQCFNNQYEKWNVEENNRTINSNRRVDEDIADSVGSKLSYLIYKDWLSQDSSEPKLPNLNYTSMQMFWISRVSDWCSYGDLMYPNIPIKNDPHSPLKFRAFGSLANNPGFSEAFSCSPGTRMNPVEKCNLW